MRNTTQLRHSFRENRENLALELNMGAKSNGKIISCREFKSMCGGVQDLETNLEFLLRPCQRALVDHWPQPTPAITAPFFTGADTAFGCRVNYPGNPCAAGLDSVRVNVRLFVSHVML
jgi:hypothetical protein